MDKIVYTTMNYYLYKKNFHIFQNIKPVNSKYIKGENENRNENENINNSDTNSENSWILIDE